MRRLGILILVFFSGMFLAEITHETTHTLAMLDLAMAVSLFLLGLSYI